MNRRKVMCASAGALVGARALGHLMGAPVSARQASPVPIVPGADWPTFHGNPARTGVAVDPGPAGEPELLWRFESGLTGAVASPVVVDGLVLFTPGMFGGASLIALDLRTGAQAWAADVDFQVFGSTPAVTDGVVCVAGMNGEIAAIDLATRELRWQVTLDVGTTSSPVVADDTLSIAAEDDHLYALAIEDGSERWRFRVGEGAEYTLGPSPAYADGLVFLGSASSESEQGVFAVDAETGEQVWQVEPERPGLGSPAVAGGMLYVAGEGSDLYAVDVASGDVHWTAEVGRTWSTPAVTDEAVFVQTMDGLLLCLDRASGETRWQADSGASWSSPVVAGDAVYVGVQGLWFEQGLYAFDAATGDPRWHMRVASVTAPVAISGDVLVVADDDGAVCAVGGSDGDALARGTDGNGAFLTRLAFSTEVDGSNRPIDPAEAFPAGTSVLIASFDHVGLRYEAAWEAIWTLDGEPLATRSDAWQGGTSRATEQISANEGSLAPGRYGLELRVDGTPLRRGEAIVG